jgi:hypothetical protein
MHFLGLDENEFTSLQKEHLAGRNGAFSVLGRYVFGSEKRKHICRLRFSAESDTVRIHTSRILMSDARETLSVNGPAYDLVSNVSKFDARDIF